jgi:putative protease
MKKLFKFVKRLVKPRTKKKSRKKIKKKIAKRVQKKGRRKKTMRKTKKKTQRKAVKKKQKKSLRKTQKRPRKTLQRKKPSKASKKAPEISKEKEIGVITHYFDKISVGVIKLKAGLKIGDKIHIKGAHDDFTQAVTSMQVNHQDVSNVGKGAEAGIKVTQRVHQNDKVYKTAEE